MIIEIDVQCGECKKNLIRVTLQLYEEARKNEMGFMCDECYDDDRKRIPRHRRGGFGAIQPRRVVRGMRHP